MLLLLLAGGISLSRQPEVEVDPICFVVYWQEDGWVRHLKASLCESARFKVEVTPASRFANESGLIVYPRGCHSIQLRQPQLAGQPCRIWYWYSGGDPSVMQPAVEWFWRCTREYFQHEFSFEVIASPLRPTHPVATSAWLQTKRLLSARRAKPLVLLLSLFFCGCYIPMLFLAEQTSSKVLDTLITKPIGVLGWARSVVLFHGLLTLSVVGPIVFAFQCNTPEVWFTIVFGFIGYMGIAFVIGCGCRSVPAASSALIVYGVLSGASIAVTHWCGVPLETFSIETRLFELFSADIIPIGSILMLTLLAALWATIGTLMFRCVRLHRAS